MPSTAQATSKANPCVLLPRRPNQCRSLIITHAVVGAKPVNESDGFTDLLFIPPSAGVACVRVAVMMDRDGSRIDRTAADRTAWSGSFAKSIKGSIPRASWILPSAVAATRRSESPAAQALTTGSIQGEGRTTHCGKSVGMQRHPANSAPEIRKIKNDTRRVAAIPRRRLPKGWAGVDTLAILNGPHAKRA